jgi:hypothetical protein
VPQRANHSADGRRPPGTRPLGRLLVERGVLGEVQLAVALKEQRRTGRRLGDLIVAMRLASAEDVARALAAQRGGFAKSEHRA